MIIMASTSVLAERCHLAEEAAGWRNSPSGSEHEQEPGQDKNKGKDQQQCQEPQASQLQESQESQRPARLHPEFTGNDVSIRMQTHKAYQQVDEALAGATPKAAPK
mgnify:CR=1 FL=1